MKKILLQIALVCFISFSANGQGPKTPPCGIVEVKSNEVIAGVQFPKGKYQINVFGMTCEEVMGDKGIFNQFLQLGNDDPLPATWIHLKDAIGAPKFVKSTKVGFRVQRVGDLDR